MKDNSKKGINRREFLGSLAASALYVAGNLEAYAQDIPSDQNHKKVLHYGKTDGKNIQLMPIDKYFSVGYNGKYGLMDVCEGNGDLVFEGRIGIEKLLSDLRSEPRERVDPKIEDFIMTSYNNYRDHQKNPKKHDSPRTPIMEVLTDKFNGSKL